MAMKSIDLAAINSALNADITEFNSKALQWTQINTAQQHLQFARPCIHIYLNFLDQQLSSIYCKF